MKMKMALFCGLIMSTELSLAMDLEQEAIYPNLAKITWVEIQKKYSEYDNLWFWEKGNNHKGIIVGGIYNLLHRGELDYPQMEEAKNLMEKFDFPTLTTRLTYLLSQKDNSNPLVMPRELIESILYGLDGLEGFITLLNLSSTCKFWNYAITTYPLEINAQTLEQKLPEGSIKKVCATFPFTKSISIKTLSEEDVDFILPLERLERIIIGSLTTLPINYISKLPHAYYPHLKVLALIDCYIYDKGAKIIASSQGVQNVEELYLNGNWITDDGTISLAESKYLGNLRLLDLQLNTIHSKGVKALLNSPNLSNLKEIYIARIFTSDEGTENECLELASVNGVKIILGITFQSVFNDLH